ncbi:MAG: hypothetical protein IKB88_09540 [Clostridia bacterium]|nr:hypothetical protein [Clostridia bacterium]
MIKTIIGYLILIFFVIGFIGTFPIVGYILGAVAILIIAFFIFKKYKKPKTDDHTDIPKEEKELCKTVKSPQIEAYSNPFLNLKSEPIKERNETAENNVIKAELVNCYHDEKQNILKKICRNKHFEDFKIDLTFEHIVENNEDYLKVLVDGEDIGFVDKESVPKILSVIDKIDYCFFDVRSQTDDGEKWYTATMSIKLIK